MKKRIVALLLTLVMVFSLIPTTVWAGEHDNQVRVIVENTTFTTEIDGKSPAWTGTLVDKWVEINQESTGMSCIVDALHTQGYTVEGSSSYISKITKDDKSLGELDGGSGSGWMGTLNDWFTNEGLNSYTVANGKLSAGDEIRMMYSMNMGLDIGSDFNSKDKTVKELSFSAGTLSPTFDKDTNSYTLTVPADTDSVVVTPTASNKNYQVHTYVGETEYKRTAAVPVADGTVITVKCGDPSWPSMNNGQYGNGSESIPGETYTVTVKAEGGDPAPAVNADVTFKGLHNAQLNYLKVYTYTDGVKGSTDLLASQSTVADGYNLKYETKLPAGDYWVEGYDGNNDCNGSLVLTVKEGENTFTLQRAYEIYATNAGWVEGVDYEIQVKVTDAGGTDLKAVTGKATAYGNTRTSCLFQEGGMVDVTLTPIGDKADSYLPVVIRKGGSDTTGKGALSLKGEIPQALGVTVIAPAGSTVSLGTQNNYYSYVFIEPDAIAKNEEDATTQVSFCLPSGGKTNFVRVQHPDGVTYWTFGKWTDGQKITVTKEDLHIGDDSFNKNTVYRFDKNVYDLGNVYLNINRQGYLNMDVGESFELDVFRNWQAIENFMNSQIALPDVNYRVISVNGGTSDVLTITPDKNNSSLATMTANKAGTAIVLVTYDAMTHMQGQSSTDSKEFSAIWPECTGVFIVTVGADGSSIQTNTLMERPGITVTKDEQKYLDAEHDILFYLGSEGASYSFMPESGCTVTVARSTVGSAMTFNGFTSEGVTVAANGEVTVTGLTTGRHIIKVEKGGLANYQVVTARGVSYDMYDAEGNKLASDTELNPGDTVSLQFHDLISPKEKLSGAYNPRFSLYYQDENGKSFSGAAGMYKFSGDSNYQKVEITIPESTEGFVYTLNGAIKVTGFDGVPTHRGISYTKGLDRQYGTGAAGVLAQLPTLALKLSGWHINVTEQKIDAIGEVTLGSEAAIAEARAAYDALTPNQQAQVSNYEKLTAAEVRLTELKSENLADIYKTTGDYLAQQGTPAAGVSIGGEWTVIGLARSGRSIPGDSSYYNALVTYVKKHINPTTMRLNRSKSTENSRIILALTALGKDVTNVSGYDLLAGLNEMSYIQRQGTNGPVWALLALDSHNYAPQGDVTREKLINTITSLQMENGAWYISATNPSADTDMTAMAVQALAPYYKTDSGVKTAVDKALVYLSSIQNADGSFSAANGGSASSESTAQVLVALCALGIDPANDSRFIKSGSTVLDGLCQFYVNGGGFRHDLNGGRDAMATEQCYYALAAYHRMKAGQKFLYDMTDVCINGVHSGEWVVTKTASCTEEGAKTRTCTVCGTVETLVLPALGHKAGSETLMNEAGHWQICSVCGAKLNETAHSYIGGQQCVCGYRKDHTRIVVSETITVPEMLRGNEKLNTPEKIETELISRIVAKNSKFTAKNTVVMDVTLQVLKDDGQWQDAKPEDITTTGSLTVLLPYPDGINSSNYRKYNFMVSHMFATDANGKTPGDVEFPSFTKTADGLLVTLTGLSPVAISYAVRTGSTGGSGSGASQPATDVKSSDTGDSSQMTLWLSGVLLSAAALIVLTRKRKRGAE